MPRTAKNPDKLDSRPVSVKASENKKHKVPSTGRKGQEARDEAAVRINLKQGK